MGACASVAPYRAQDACQTGAWGSPARARWRGFSFLRCCATGRLCVCVRARVRALDLPLARLTHTGLGPQPFLGDLRFDATHAC